MLTPRKFFKLKFQGNFGIPLCLNNRYSRMNVETLDHQCPTLENECSSQLSLQHCFLWLEKYELLHSLSCWKITLKTLCKSWEPQAHFISMFLRSRPSLLITIIIIANTRKGSLETSCTNKDTNTAQPLNTIVSFLMRWTAGLTQREGNTLVWVWMSMGKTPIWAVIASEPMFHSERAISG